MEYTLIIVSAYNTVGNSNHVHHPYIVLTHLTLPTPHKQVLLLSLFSGEETEAQSRT